MIVVDSCCSSRTHPPTITWGCQIRHPLHVAFEGLRPVTDVSVGDWIAPRLRGFGGRVNQVIPDGFAAYARVLHPALDEHRQPVPWAEVCRRTGRTAHPLMQWTSIAGAEWSRSDTLAGPPLVGCAPPAVLAAVLDVLRRFTPEACDCYHALWEGWGWLHSGGWAFLTSADDPPSPASSGPEPSGLAAEVLNGPRLELPHRRYVLFRGPLHAALRLGHQVTVNWFDPQSPSLLWPADRSWCLATEVDFDSTLIGGSPELIDAILKDARLDAWRVQPIGDLTIHGDHINATEQHES
jgi:hypothetical protein